MMDMEVVEGVWSINSCEWVSVWKCGGVIKTRSSISGAIRVNCGRILQCCPDSTKDKWCNVRVCRGEVLNVITVISSPIIHIIYF